MSVPLLVSIQIGSSWPGAIVGLVNRFRRGAAAEVLGRPHRDGIRHSGVLRSTGDPAPWQSRPARSVPGENHLCCVTSPSLEILLSAGTVSAPRVARETVPVAMQHQWAHTLEVGTRGDDLQETRGPHGVDCCGAEPGYRPIGTPAGRHEPGPASHEAGDTAGDIAHGEDPTHGQAAGCRSPHGANRWGLAASLDLTSGGSILVYGPQVASWESSHTSGHSAPCHTAPRPATNRHSARSRSRRTRRFP